MEVILNKDVDRIGKAGTVVKVKDGFARNYLLPNKLALPLNSANLKKFEQEKEKKSQDQQKKIREAQELKKKLDGLSLTIAVLSQDDEKLYGSIGAVEIAEALKEEGFTVDKNAIILEQPIKALGIFEVSLKLHPEVDSKIKIWIVKK